MMIIWQALAGFVLDLFLGDPPRMPHPVVWMGKVIRKAEAGLRQRFEKSPSGEFRAGLILAAGLPALVYVISFGVIRLLAMLHPAAGFLAGALWSWQALAVRDMVKESKNVYRNLKEAGLEESRRAVARIVGRDTGRLDGAGVARAAIETVAENFSDGVAAPMFYLFIGGAPLALCYKAINTMDSMIGYKNQKYLYFGRAAARLDDAANYIPARLSALLLIAAAAFCGGDSKNAAKIWKRDRRNHASPNSAQTESVMAGALHLRLAGPAWYFGEYYEKPFIGEDDRQVEAEDILRADRIFVCGSFLAFLLFALLRAGLLSVIM